jgi:hypothetical protein
MIRHLRVMAIAAVFGLGAYGLIWGLKALVNLAFY